MSSNISDTLLGTIIDGKYRLESRIGLGGFGTVYRATHISIGRPVAIKILHINISTDNMERLRLEGVSASQIEHPNAVSTLDFGVTSSGAAYLVMELLEGHLLSDEIYQHKKLSVGRCAEVLIPVCNVLAEAHAKGIIHRDIKPDNIFIQQTKRGEIVKVLDFGIAKLSNSVFNQNGRTLTAAGTVMGTPEYMAPERIRNKTYDGRSDIYSLGIILYQMLSGKIPFESADGDYAAVMWMQVNDLPQPIGQIDSTIPLEIESLVLQMLQKDPELRPTAESLAQHLTWFVGYQNNEDRFINKIFSEEQNPDHTPTLIANVTTFLPLPSQVKPTMSEDFSRVIPNIFNKSGKFSIPANTSILTKNEVRRFNGHFYVTSIAFSQDGRLFLSAKKDKKIGVWEVENNQELCCFGRRNMFPIRASAFSPDNKHVLISGTDNLISLWNIETGQEINNFVEHNQVTTIEFSANGQFILSGGQDKNICVWKVDSGYQIYCLKGHRAPIACVGFSPDNRYAISVGIDEDIRLWQLENGKEVADFKLDSIGYDSMNFTISDNIQNMISVGNENAHEKENRWRGKRQFNSELISTGYPKIIFSPNGQNILFGGQDTIIRIWEKDTGHQIHRLKGHGSGVNSVIFSSDSKWILSGSDDRTIRLWETESNKEVHRFEGHKDKIYRVAFAPENRILSSSKDGTIRLWEIGNS